MLANNKEDNIGSSGQPLSIAILGFGTVGQAAARILVSSAHSQLRLTHIYNRDIARKKADWISSEVVWTQEIEEVLASDVDVVVELIGGLTPAKQWIQRALEAGKSVVTANKQVISEYGIDLIQVAHRSGQQLLFEAAVAGGIPVIRGLKEGISGDRLYQILGILNGTCNYILTQIESKGVSFNTALGKAQQLGFAEVDPSADVEGWDSQAKLAILSWVGFGRQLSVSEIPVRSIAPIEPIDFTYSNRLGCTIRQVSRAKIVGRKVEASVLPALVPLSSTLARIQNNQNLVVAAGEFSGETAFSGFGAGGAPTAVAVVSDLLSIFRVPVLPASQITLATFCETIPYFLSPHYVRFFVKDQPGIIAQLANIFVQNKVNIDAVLQESGLSKSELPFVVSLNTCRSDVVLKAIQEIQKFDFLVKEPLWLPILN